MRSRGMQRRHGRRRPISEADIVFGPGSGFVMGDPQPTQASASSQSDDSSAQGTDTAAADSPFLLPAPSGQATSTSSAQAASQTLSQSATTTSSLSETQAASSISSGSVALTSSSSSEPSQSQATSQSSASPSESSSRTSAALSPSQTSSSSIPSSGLVSSIASASTTAGATASLGSSDSSVLPSATTQSTNAQSANTSIPTANVAASSSSGAGSHSAQFYVGIVFLVIVVLACIASFSAWLFRSRKCKSIWCFGRRDDDIESQDLDFGLGSFLGSALHEKTAQRAPPFDPCRPRPVPLPAFEPTPRPPPPPVHLRSVETRDHMLGPLHVKNLMPGDISSSDEARRPASRNGYGFGSSRTMDTPALRAMTPVDGLGTPRESVPGSTPRFLGLGGRGLDLPWSPAGLRWASSPTSKRFTYSHARNSSGRIEEGKEDWDELPPLPLPPFDQKYAPAQPIQGNPGTDGWGAALRTSLFSAFSSVTGAYAPKSSAETQDHYTAFPPSSSRSRMDGSRQGTLRSSHSSKLREGDAITSWITGTQLPSSRSGLGISEFSNNEKDDERPPVPQATTPLVWRKKNTVKQPTSKREIASRASSVYSSGTPRAPVSHIRRPCSARTRDGRHRQTSNLSRPTRPKFLARGSSSGCSLLSLGTPASVVSKATDEELLAKRTMMLRARRKRTMDSATRLRDTTLKAVLDSETEAPCEEM